MKITTTLHVTDRKTWREWLQANYRTESEIWLVYFRKDAGKSHAPYRRIRIACIDSARRRPEEFRKRLDHFLKLTEKNKQFGFGIQACF